MIKQSVWGVVVLVGLLGVMAWVVREPAAAQQPQQPAGQRWEYKVATLSGIAPPAMEEGLNRLGAEGWEICIARPDRSGGALDVVILKRPRR